MTTRDNRASTLSWVALRAKVVAALIIGIMSARILATHKIFSGTYDESVHITAGVELLSLHRYTYALEHTPVARIPAAIGPVMAGARLPAIAPGPVELADSVMRSGPGYRRNLELARAGILPFFILTGLFLFLWTQRIAGESVAVVAVFLFSLTPPVLAHSGLVTTDAAAMASFTALLFVFQLWLEQPDDLKRAIWLGVAAGAAVGSKLSAIPFFAACAGCVLMAQQLGWRSLNTPAKPFLSWVLAKRLGLASVIAAVTLYATYGFTIGRALGFPAPLSEFVFGLMLLLRHNIDGNVSYFFGETYVGRRWLFFPVALAVKTPIPLLLLGMAGSVVATYKWWGRHGIRWLIPLVAFVAPLTVAILSNINLGTRHVLPIFPPLALLGGIGWVALWKSSILLRGVALALGVWMLAGTWRSHPDYLAYFNEFADQDPGAVLVESDLDWGQDLERLADTVRARRITGLSIAYYGFEDRLGMLFPDARRVGPGEVRPVGWFAVSETRYRAGWTPLPNSTKLTRPDSLSWLRSYKPVAMVGSSIRLYFIPPP